MRSLVIVAVAILIAGCADDPPFEVIETGTVRPVAIGPLKSKEDIPNALLNGNGGSTYNFGEGQFLFFELPEFHAPVPIDVYGIGATRLPGRGWCTADSQYVSGKGWAIRLPMDLSPVDYIDVRIGWPGVKTTMVRIQHPPYVPLNTAPSGVILGQAVARDQGPQWTFAFRPPAPRADELDTVLLDAMKVSPDRGKPQVGGSMYLKADRATSISRLNAGGVDAIDYEYKISYFKLVEQGTVPPEDLLLKFRWKGESILQRWESKYDQWGNVSESSLKDEEADAKIRYRRIQAVRTLDSAGRVPLEKGPWPKRPFGALISVETVLGDLTPDEADRLFGPTKPSP
ncbi:hypothetical protein EON81_03060 [bacterium]|nr:MAG: hypothetical protein EON81_03060 [bacterium]